jgi:hypothetical protein
VIGLLARSLLEPRMVVRKQLGANFAPRDTESSPRGIGGFSAVAFKSRIAVGPAHIYSRKIC